MKIAFYCPMKPIDHPIPSGDRLIARDLFEYLENNGHQPFILSDLRTLFFHRKPARYLLVYLPYHFFRSLIKVLIKKPNIYLSYHVKNSTPDFFGPLLGKITSKPYYIFETNHAKHISNNVYARIANYMMQAAFMSAAGIFFNKCETDISMPNKFGTDRMYYIKPAINLAGFQDYSETDIRKIYRIDSDIPIIFSCAMCRVGRKADSIRFLIDCLEKLLSKSHKFVWIHAGGDGEYDDLRGYAKNKLGDLAIMPGTMVKNDVYALMQASDIFAFPGINETLGMVYLEAQYYQTPVVAFDNGGISEVVKNNITGFLVPPMDMDAYINAIEILLSNPEKRLAMGREARKSIIQDHDINKNYQKILDVIEA